MEAKAHGSPYSSRRLRARIKRSAAFLLTSLLFCVATVPVAAQTPSTEAEPLPVGAPVGEGSLQSDAPAPNLPDSDLLEGSRFPDVWLRVYVQPVTEDETPLGLDAGPSMNKSGGREAPEFHQAADALEMVEEQGTVLLSAIIPGGPVGTDDVYKALADQTLTIAAPGVLANDIDLNGETLTAVAILDNVDNGTLAVFANGGFTYTPNAGFTGTDTFVYQMRDASFNLSEPTTVTIEVIEGNRNPVSTDDAYGALTGTTMSVATPGILANDVDPDGELLTAVAILDNVDNGTLAVFANGSFTYTPSAGFTGTDSFVYQMRDASFNLSEPATVTIEVIEGNRPPLGTDDVYAAVENTTLSAAAPGFLINDIDPDGETLTAVAILDNVDNGTLAAFANGGFTYTPNAGFTGTDAFVYQMRDASLNFSEPTTVTINVFDPENPEQPDTTPPGCEIAAVNPGPPTTLEVQVQDGESGLAQIEVLKNKNASVAVPAFATGTTDVLIVTATKLDQNKASTVMLKVTDVAGNSTTCDPVLTTISAVAETFSLSQNYPNPFNPTTTIRFDVPVQAHVRLNVFDALGRQVAMLVDEVVAAGQHAVSWDAQDAAGKALPAGIYLYRIETGSFTEVHKMTLLR